MCHHTLMLLLISRLSIRQVAVLSKNVWQAASTTRPTSTPRPFMMQFVAIAATGLFSLQIPRLQAQV